MKEVKDMNFAEGEILLFNKPRTWSSFDVVRKVRGAMRFKKIGHAGTLDPLASGLLILCTGRKTKLIQGIQDAEKEYVATIALGATTESYDLEHPRENETDVSHLTREMIEARMAEFTGDIQQLPPAFSAIKIGGQRAYESARKGKPKEMPPRQVTISNFEILEFPGPEQFVARINCSKGTYIRSLAHDLGKALGVGGHLAGLVRTRIGDYSLENAWEISDFADKLNALRPASPSQE
ncbi:MAG: tRNA pseudouridine(55) synthase TruB [Bacteroidia bacterium]|nr:tRNA pseudouridine(55) synthase TruB [Bacteroidia bacterium]